MQLHVRDQILDMSAPQLSQAPAVFVLWTLVRRRYIVLLLGGTCGSALAGLYCLLAGPLFQSQTRIVVTLRDPVLPTHGTQSGSQTDQALNEGLLATHIEILRSKETIRLALKDGELGRRRSIVDALQDDQDPVEYVAENLRVTRGGEGQGKGADVINLSFRHTSAVDCRDVLLALLQSYQRFLSEMTEHPVEQALQLVNQAYDKFRNELNSAEQNYQKFIQDAPVVWKGEESLDIAQVESLEAELTQIELKMIKAHSRLKTIEEARAGASGHSYTQLQQLALIDEEHIPRLSLLVTVNQGGASAERAETVSLQFHQLLQFLIKQKQLQRWAGRNHPDFLQNQQAIDTIGAFLRQNKPSSAEELNPATLVEAYVALLRNDLTNLLRRKDQFEALLKGKRNHAKISAELKFRKGKLENEVLQARELFAGVQNRLDEIRTVRDYSGFRTKVIEQAETGEKVAPNPPLLLSLGGLLGLCMGMAVAVVVDHNDPRYSGAECDTATGHRHVNGLA